MYCLDQYIYLLVDDGSLILGVVCFRLLLALPTQ